jgi:zinc transport system substrate-binding protein
MLIMVTLLKFLKVFHKTVFIVTPDDCKAVGKGVFALYHKIPFLFSNEKNGNDDKSNTALLNTLKFVSCIVCFLLPICASAKDIHIVTTIKPIESLIANIIDDSDSVVSLINGHYSEHSFSLKPSHIARIYTSDAVILINPDFETFMRSSFKIIPEKTLVITLSDTPDLTLYPTQKHGNTNKVHTHNAIDYHIWLSPSNAIHIIDYLEKQLSLINPEKQTIYQKNAATMREKLVTLDETLKTQLLPIADKPFMVFHNGFQYFIKDYHLNLVGTITNNPTAYASVNQIKQAQQQLEDNKVMCVFKEPQFSDTMIDTVIADTHTHIGTLDPLGSSINSGKNHYFDMMNALSVHLSECLNHN